MEVFELFPGWNVPTRYVYTVLNKIKKYVSTFIDSMILRMELYCYARPTDFYSLKPPCCTHVLKSVHIVHT